MKEIIFIISLFIACFSARAQDTLSAEARDLGRIATFYKETKSLQIDVAYRVYADTLGKKLLDSSTERFISNNNRTYSNHLNTVSIVGDTFVFFIDHERQVAYLDRKPILHEKSVTGRVQEFLDRHSGCKRYVLAKNLHKYRIASDSLAFDWIDVYINPETKTISKFSYKLSPSAQIDGAKLVEIEFRNQKFGKAVGPEQFSLKSYIAGKDSQGLLAPYSTYQFYNYLH